jgi:tetratricopeptide (TPR) repeat protein
MRLRIVCVVVLAALTCAPAALRAQSMTVLDSGEDARRCSNAAELTATLRTASDEDLEYCVRALELGVLRPYERAGTWVNRGIIEAALGDPAAAMRSYDKALAILPELPEPRVGRGNVLFLAGNLAAAIAEYDRALALGTSRRHVVLLNRAMALEAAGQLDAAERDYREALQLAPDWPPATTRLERVLAKRKAAGAPGQTSEPKGATVNPGAAEQP